MGRKAIYGERLMRVVYMTPEAFEFYKKVMFISGLSFSKFANEAMEQFSRTPKFVKLVDAMDRALQIELEKEVRRAKKAATNTYKKKEGSGGSKDGER